MNEMLSNVTEASVEVLWLAVKEWRPGLYERCGPAGEFLDSYCGNGDYMEQVTQSFGINISARKSEELFIG